MNEAWVLQRLQERREHSFADWFWTYVAARRHSQLGNFYRRQARMRRRSS